MILNRKNKIRNGFRSGFSLIELSIVILILSIVASAAMNVIGKKTQAEKSTATYKKLEKIAKAIKVYVQENDSLPCPMGINPTPTSGDFGLQSADSLEEPSKCTKWVIKSENNMIGFIPTLTLGLPPEYMYDEWGRLITYVMSMNLLHHMNNDANISNIDIKNINSDGEETTQMWRYAKPSEINTEVEDCINPGSSITPLSTGELIPVCAAFVLISHGANGHGSYNFSGIELNSPIAGDYEVQNTPNYISKENTESINIWNMPDNNSVSTDNEWGSSQYFDDIIYFLSKESILNTN